MTAPSRVLGATVIAGCGLATVLCAHTALNARLLRRTRPVTTPITERVSVLIPARDEARNIAACLDAVLASSDLADLEVLVLDDGSADGTGDLARKYAPRVTVLDGAPLPSGWLGKPFACDQLGGAATGTVLVFLDADVRVAPDAIARTVELLRRRRFGLVSPYPRQLAVTPSERLVQPLLQWLWLTFLPLRLAERTRPVSTTAANGQLLAIDREVYRHIGGHGAVRDEVVEDVALARACKRAGAMATVVDGTDLATCRMYDSWAAARDGYSKSLWSATGSPAGGAVLSALLATAFVIPPIAVVTGPRRWVALAGATAGVGSRIISARRTGGRVGDAWQHPASISALIMLIARSWHLRRRGALQWKGRSL